MSNLKNLKGTSEELRRISITDDYTSDEREQIKSWVKKSRKKVHKIRKTCIECEGIQKTGCAWYYLPGNDPTILKTFKREYEVTKMRFWAKLFIYKPKTRQFGGII